MCRVAGGKTAREARAPQAVGRAASGTATVVPFTVGAAFPSRAGLPRRPTTPRGVVAPDISSIRSEKHAV
jgi:hypothetical protein